MTLLQNKICHTKKKEQLLLMLKIYLSILNTFTKYKALKLVKNHFIYVFKRRVLKIAYLQPSFENKNMFWYSFLDRIESLKVNFIMARRDVEASWDRFTRYCVCKIAFRRWEMCKTRLKVRHM